jgi:UDP-glucuronate 4-epimerase
MLSILITGGAGFISNHLQNKLTEKYDVSAIDLLDRNNKITEQRSINIKHIKQGDIRVPFIHLANKKPEVVIHLAAETGIAGSLTNPEKYFDTNVKGTFNVLEECRKSDVKYLIYASSSSVYEPNQTVMHEDAKTENQLSFYGTTKKMCELMVENYCKQFGMVAIGLRFFTVYGSYTRTDMAAYKFMQAINAGSSVTLYNNGDVYRDFTHVSDVVNSIELLLEKITNEPNGTHLIFNIGFGTPISVTEFATCIAKNLDKPLHVDFMPLPQNELPITHSNTERLQQYINYKPKCSLNEGILEMTTWYKKNNYEQ